MSSPIQTRFDGGEISPRLSGRFDSELYKKALRQCSNFEPLAQGSLRMRSGSGKQIALTGGVLERFTKIHTSTGEDFLIEFLNGSINIYDISTGVAVQTAVANSELINNGDFSLPNGAGWLGRTKIGNWLQDNDTNVAFTDNAGNQAGFAITNTAVTGAIIGVVYQKIVLAFPATVHIQFDMASNIATSGDHLRVKVSTSNPTGWANTWTGGGEAFMYDNVPPGLVAAGSGNPFAPPTFTHVDLGNVHLAAGTYWISFEVNTSNVLSLDNVSAFATYDSTQVSIPAPWLNTETEEINFVTESGRNRTVFVHPNHAPWFLLYGGTPGTWTWGNVTFAVAAGPPGDGLFPLGWGNKGSTNVPAGWNWKGITTSLAANNWPSTVEFNDGRIYYGGEPAQQNRILGSRSGSSDDFTLGANPGDSLDFKLATKGAVRWLLAHTKLLAGTDLGYNAVTGSKGYPLVGDISAPSQSGGPSASIQATLAGSTAIYSSADLRRVRAVTFDFQTQGFESKDVTFAAEHISLGLIKELHHAWTPDLTLIVLLKDGTLAMCSYEPREQVTAWWTLALTGGTIYTAAVQQGPLGAYLWMAVGRQGGVYLEKLNLSEGEPLSYLDASISGNSDANGVFAGLDHLNGSTVRAVVNGALAGDFLVIGGMIQMGVDFANSPTVAGLPYRAKAVTLPRDTRTGKAQSSMIGVILNNSAFPLINGKRTPDRAPATPQNTPQPLFTGKKKQLNPGWSDEDPVTIEQDLPFRTEVCAIYATVSVERIA